MAAAAELRTPNMHRAKRIAPRECGWKHGDSGERARTKKTCLTKKLKNRLDSDRPSHGRRLRSFECCGEFRQLGSQPRIQFRPRTSRAAQQENESASSCLRLSHANLLQ